MAKKIKVELIENFLVVWNFLEGSDLYKQGFYGKPLGIAKPKTPEFEVPLILDLIEGVYLTEKKIITVHQGIKKQKVSLKKLRDIAKKLYGEFDEKYFAYCNFREKGLIVTSGIKFGCDFAVYKYGPGLEHAPYMVSVKSSESEITATDIVKAGRLATTVRKRFIIANTNPTKNKITHVIFRWFKA